MRFRLLASALALVFAATPLLGVVCQMDCDQPPKSSACHESTTSSDAPSVRGTHHLCEHDHTGGSAVLATGAAGVRDSAGIAFVSFSVPAIAHAAVAKARTALAEMHGPPGLSGRRVSSRTTILRI